MTGKKTNPFFIVACCCLFLVLVGLCAPAVADAPRSSSQLVITAQISLAAFNITPTGIGRNQATIIWQTNGNTTSAVEFGPTTGYGYSGADGSIGHGHAIILTGLYPGTSYHYRVIATDQYGNRFTSTDMTFTTGGGGSGGGGSGSNPYSGNPGRTPSGTVQASPGAGSPLPAAAAAIAVYVYLRNKKPPEKTGPAEK